MSFKLRNKLIQKIIRDLEKDGLRMEAGTFVDGWKYKISIPQKDWSKKKK